MSGNFSESNKIRPPHGASVREGEDWFGADVDEEVTEDIKTEPEGHANLSSNKGKEYLNSPKSNEDVETENEGKEGGGGGGPEEPRTGEEGVLGSGEGLGSLPEGEASTMIGETVEDEKAEVSDENVREKAGWLSRISGEFLSGLVSKIISSKKVSEAERAAELRAMRKFEATYSLQLKETFRRLHHEEIRLGRRLQREIEKAAKEKGKENLSEELIRARVFLWLELAHEGARIQDQIDIIEDRLCDAKLTAEAVLGASKLAPKERYTEADREALKKARAWQLMREVLPELKEEKSSVAERLDNIESNLKTIREEIVPAVKAFFEQNRRIDRAFHAGVGKGLTVEDLANHYQQKIIEKGHQDAIRICRMRAIGFSEKEFKEIVGLSAELVGKNQEYSLCELAQRYQELQEGDIQLFESEVLTGSRRTFERFQGILRGEGESAAEKRFWEQRRNGIENKMPEVDSGDPEALKGREKLIESALEIEKLRWMQYRIYLVKKTFEEYTRNYSLEFEEAVKDPEIVGFVAGSVLKTITDEQGRYLNNPDDENIGFNQYWSLKKEPSQPKGKSSQPPKRKKSEDPAA